MATAYAVGATLSVNGSPLSDELAAHIEELVVDDDRVHPVMFAITLADPKRDIVGRTGLKAGAEVEIEVTGQGADEERPLVVGDVVSVDVDYDEIGSRAVVRGYDASHRMHRSRGTRVFSNVTDGDIVAKVAREIGLEVGPIEPTSAVHDHVSQANLTDWEFLAGRAQALDLDLTVDSGKLTLVKRATAADAPSELSLEDPRHLVFPQKLISFHGRVSAAAQVDTVVVRGYDATRKVAVGGKADAGTTSNEIAFGKPSTLAGSFGAPALMDVLAPVRTDQEAEDAARAIAERIGSTGAEVEGIARGSTALRAGVAIRVSQVSEEFSGAYVISRVRHVIDGSGYRTQFWVSGRQDRSLLGLVSAASNGNGSSSVAAPGRGSGRADHRFYGVVRGLVGDIADPEKLGRVKVKLPWLEESWSSNWAPVMQLGAGPDSGTFFLPAVDDEVLVAFTHGDINMPVVLGGLFNPIDKPPTYDQFLDVGKVVGRTIVSRKGHELTFLDSNDLSGIQVVAVSDSRLPVVSIALDGKDSKLVIQSSGDVTVEAEGNVSLKGSKISVEAQGDLVLKGTMVKIN